MKNTIIEFLFSLLAGIGSIFLVSPFILNWWIHGNYDRYIWIISGPSPYNKFGGGPFQMAMYLGLFLVGIVLIVLYFVGKKVYNKFKINKP